MNCNIKINADVNLNGGGSRELMSMGIDTQCNGAGLICDESCGGDVKKTRRYR